MHSVALSTVSVLGVSPFFVGSAQEKKCAEEASASPALVFVGVFVELFRVFSV
jgi:hypothetical protein